MEKMLFGGSGWYGINWLAKKFGLDWTYHVVQVQEGGTRGIRRHIDRSEIFSWGVAGGRNRRLTLFINVFDKNGQFFWICTSYICLSF